LRFFKEKFFSKSLLLSTGKQEMALEYDGEIRFLSLKVCAHSEFENKKKNTKSYFMV